MDEHEFQATQVAQILVLGQQPSGSMGQAGLVAAQGVACKHSGILSLLYMLCDLWPSFFHWEIREHLRTKGAGKTGSAESL